ncbi:cinnamoyl-CoA reductase 1-like isoform X1 [Vitis riparia]|uniref:cinnamoyl-CoA reductase 1-like isoform X1 n=1 Tax=Vitis riparia TaxID=96939 RepID=UPI00155A4539|nr:cinnamoyl-CoA reductase 1-like isoform X1 [Vitis riparia]
MSVAVAEKVVCVTGGAGYIASWLVKLLLLRGYTVKATLRNPDDPTKIEHLLALEGAKERLHLFKADLLEEGSFDSIVEGCEGVFHTASPVLLEVANPKVELIDPAVNGTLNVLRSCTKVPSIRRVVVTSSIVATIFNGKTLTPDVVVDETWFSDPAFCEESKLWYVLSKTLAEEAAWKFAKENGIDLVTMNPGFVIGPFLQPTINLTMEIILNLINGGAQTFPSSTYRWVDVRDVANAHVQAFEISSASGRYCLVERVTYCSEAIKILQELYPALHLPQKNADDEPPMPTYQISKEKVKSLAIDFIPLEVSLKDTMENLKEKNFIKL